MVQSTSILHTLFSFDVFLKSGDEKMNYWLDRNLIYMWLEFLLIGSKLPYAIFGAELLAVGYIIIETGFLQGVSHII